MFLARHQLNINQTFISTPLWYSSAKSFERKIPDPIKNVYGWRPVGHTPAEQRRLEDLSTVVAAWPATAEDNVPVVPAITADNHLLVLSAAASRVRFGSSVTFIMVYPNDMKTVLPKHIPSDSKTSSSLNLWCIFDDGSVTPAYSYDSGYGNDRASLLDCSLTPFANDELWRYNRTLRVYLASLIDKDRNAPILKAYVSVPKPISITSTNSSQTGLTLCTSPLHNGADYLKQWILFHHLVGFRKFVVYNTTDNGQQVQKVIDQINRYYPNLIDVVQWNFSSLGLTDALGGRYFQVEALHDCLTRYGDQSEWLGTIDPDEYIVPLNEQKNIADALHENFGRYAVGSVNLWSYFFCSQHSNKYTTRENDTNRLVIERFISRAPNAYRGGREKYLYRPKFVHYLSIHHQIVGLARVEPANQLLMFAHYAAMSRFRTASGCHGGRDVNDTSIYDRFGQQLKNLINSVDFSRKI